MRSFTPLLPVVVLLLVVAFLAGSKERGARAVGGIVLVLVGIIIMAALLALIGRES